MPNLSDYAILGRTNQSLVPYETLLMKYKVPYHLLGQSGYWHQAEVRKAVEMLKKHMTMPLPSAVAMVFYKLEQHYTAADATREDNDALENIYTLREMTKKFTTTQEFVMFANRCMHAKRTQKGVALGTVHSAKGLEWQNVFLINAREGMMPHHKAMDVFEERRIFFVAISRAAERLTISWSGQPSSFIRPDIQNLKEI